MASQDAIWAAILDERRRQAIKHPTDNIATPLDEDTRTRILGEEYGEVCKAVRLGDFGSLREELVQVAAVAVGWLETFPTAPGEADRGLR